MSLRGHAERCGQRRVGSTGLTELSLSTPVETSPAGRRSPTRFHERGDESRQFCWLIGIPIMLGDWVFCTRSSQTPDLRIGGHRQVDARRPTQVLLAGPKGRSRLPAQVFV